MTILWRVGDANNQRFLGFLLSAKQVSAYGAAPRPFRPRYAPTASPGVWGARRWLQVDWNRRSLRSATPDFLWRLVALAGFMRLSLLKAAHVAVAEGRVAGNPGALRSG
jgi:hypothetical protein